MTIVPVTIHAILLFTKCTYYVSAPTYFPLTLTPQLEQYGKHKFNACLSLHTYIHGNPFQMTVGTYLTLSVFIVNNKLCFKYINETLEQANRRVSYFFVIYMYVYVYYLRNLLSLISPKLLL